ncbi:MAG: ester cyclase [Acidimicrobiales bacterium]
MTSNAARAATLRRALRARLDGDGSALRDLYTDDVTAWTPALSASSLDELTAELERRDAAFSDVELEVAPLDVGGDYACAEWSVTMTHTGPLVLAGGEVVEPTGTRITVNGATVAEFRGDRICSLRQYWDELAVFEQIGLVGGDHG